MTEAARHYASPPSYAVGERNDCSVRALACAAAISYSESHDIWSRFGRKPRKGPPVDMIVPAVTSTVPEGKARVLDFCGHGRKGRPTLGRFMSEYGHTGSWWVWVTNHALAVVDGEVYDWDFRLSKTRVRLEMAIRLA